MDIDFDKIRESKINMMKQFKASYEKAKAEGTITYRPIKFKSNHEPLYGVLCGKEA
jgi:ubiquitin C-terminal hydrolase